MALLDLASVVRAIPTSLIAAGIWFLLAGATASAWIVGVPFILAAGALAGTLAQPAPWHLRPLALVRLLWLVAVETVRATVDIGRRCLASDVHFPAGVVQLPMHLAHPRARQAFAYAISVVPGTVTVHVGDGAVTVHVLDKDGPWRADLERLQSAVAAAFEPHAMAFDT